MGISARIIVGLVAFLGTRELLQGVSSPSGGPLVGAKREFLDARREHVDTVFVGSSHVYRGFVPSEFDRILRTAGVPATSLNYGVQLPDLLESRYLIGEVLREVPGLQRLFFEYQTLAPQIDPLNAFKPRSIYWHDRDSTRLALERTVYWGGELGDALRYVEGDKGTYSVFGLLDRLLPSSYRMANMHAQHYLTNLLFVGRAKDVGRGLLGRGHGQLARFKPDAGYVSLEAEDRRLSEQGQQDNPYSRRRRHFGERLEAYSMAVEQLDSRERFSGDDEWMNTELTRVHDLHVIETIARQVQDAGVEFILVIMPQQSCDREVERRLAEEVGVPVLRFNMPSRYPRLYEPEMRFDSGHLSEEGALHFTRVLAGDYLRHGAGGEG